MKKHIKWIALLLAGLITFFTLCACNSGTPSNSEDGNEDKEQNDTAFPPKELAPNEIKDALREINTFTIGLEIKRQSSAESYTVNRTYIKNGDIVKAIETTTSEFYNSSSEIYVDLKNQTQYSLNNGEWSATSTEVSLEELYADVLFSDLLMNNDSYEEYDSQNDCTPLKEDALRAYYNLEETVEISGYMKVQKSTYTFFVISEGTSYTITVEFTAEKLTLPEVSTSSAN